MTVFVSLPDEILGKDLLKFWNHLEKKVKQEYKNSRIISNYTGDGRIEDAQLVLFLQEYKDTPSCKRDMKKCKDLDISYNFFAKFYAPDRFFYPSPTQFSN